MSLDGIPTSTKPVNTSVRLLQAARDLVGGDERLAERLQMSRLLLRWYMAGRDELPSHLLLRTVDLILEERESGRALPAHPALPVSGSIDGADLPG